MRLIKDDDPAATTLSIGDGANDVAMITAANVGVGIAGLEGAQASRAADYSIGQFKHLKPLLFVHGREAYRRNAYLICYIFYKNALMVLPQYWFGFYSGFSGQPLYEPWMYQCYNIAFTAFPIIWFGVFDFQCDKKDFLQNPSLYKLGLENQCFNKPTFYKWILKGIIQAAVIMLICIPGFL